MKSKLPATSPTKARTGIKGFDKITHGGLPRGRTTLLSGGSGSGKTIFALQFLTQGAKNYGQPGIFVAFEETSERIMINAEDFGWKIEDLMQEKKLLFIDAQPPAELILSGTFDLSGMLAALSARLKEINARRIVFDAIDIVLALLPDEAAKRREVYRLHDWLVAHKITGLITAKSDWDDTSPFNPQPFGFMQFMVDCSLILDHRMERGVSQRYLRVQKYRGSGVDENESSFVIGKGGFEIAALREPHGAAASKPTGK